MGGSDTGAAGALPYEAAGAEASTVVHAGALRLPSMAFMERDLADKLVVAWMDVGDGVNAVAVEARAKIASRRFMAVVV